MAQGLARAAAVPDVVVWLVVLMAAEVVAFLSGRPDAGEAARRVRGLAEAWVTIRSAGPGDGAPVRKAPQVEAPAPVSLKVVDDCVPIERFAARYAGVLVRCSPWQPSRYPSPLELLQAINVNVSRLTQHESAMVAWQFWDDLEQLWLDVGWARREGVMRQPIGVQCREIGCDGEYEIEVRPGNSSLSPAERKRAFGAKRHTAVCTKNREHRLDAKGML
ncbi:hypothetical protein LGT39_12490 [Demequina sp. TTPB684]|nr:hypothetical protein [Demequina sp. TTPB684]